MLMSSLLVLSSVALSADAEWPSFRGPQAAGVKASAATAVSWNVETGENILWSTTIPGLAHSSPVIAGDRVFVTTAIREAGDAELKVGLYGSIAPVEDESPHEMKVYCLDRKTGDIIWEQTSITAVPKVKRHPKGSHAASSPATDGRYVVAFFASEGLYCYDIDGTLKWSKDFGVLDSGFYMMKNSQWGFASSPVIHDDVVLIQCDIQEGSFLAAFDLATGEERWRTERAEVPGWSTPTVVARGDGKQVICNGWKHIGGYDFETGKELWKVVGGGDIPVPTPIVRDDLIYITNAHGRMAPIIAVKTDAAGELELSADDEHIEWFYRSRGNYMQTPIVYDDLIYFCNDGGVMSCYEAATGTAIYRERLSSGQTGFTASPVAAGEKLYYTSETGEIHVVKVGREFELLGMNEMGTECMATPAIAGDVIFWRTRTGVVAVGDTSDN